MADSGLSATSDLLYSVGSGQVEQVIEDRSLRRLRVIILNRRVDSQMSIYIVVGEPVQACQPRRQDGLIRYSHIIERARVCVYFLLKRASL